MILNFYLDKRANKKGECPIILSVNILKTRLVATTGFSVNPSDWNKDKMKMQPHRVNSKKQTSAEINEALLAFETRFTEFEKECEGKPSVDDLKKAMQGKVEKKQKAPSGLCRQQAPYLLQ